MVSRLRGAALAIAAILIVMGHSAALAADLTASFSWAPVRLGAGGFVTGFVTHPLDSTVRYCRTDVGNCYRWSQAAGEWKPMLVHSATAGLPATVTRAPQVGGVESIAVDPSTTKIFYMANTGGYSNDVRSLYPPVLGAIYKSVDGGDSFVVSDLNVAMQPNGNDRANGERISVDPANGQVVYFGSHAQGLWRSTNGGIHWTQVTESASPGITANVSSIQFGKAGSTTSFGQSVSATVYAVVLNGSVYKSADGGSNWSIISSGTALDGKCLYTTTDSSRTLYVVQNQSNTVWRYKSGAWSNFTVTGFWANAVGAIAVDPTNNQRLWAIGIGGAIARSSDGGSTWVNISDWLLYANAVAWLPQPPGWRSNGGIFIDASGKLWVP